MKVATWMETSWWKRSESNLEEAPSDYERIAEVNQL